MHQEAFHCPAVLLTHLQFAVLVYIFISWTTTLTHPRQGCHCSLWTQLHWLSAIFLMNMSYFLLTQSTPLILLEYINNFNNSTFCSQELDTRTRISSQYLFTLLLFPSRTLNEYSQNASPRLCNNSLSHSYMQSFQATNPPQPASSSSLMPSCKKRSRYQHINRC